MEKENGKLKSSKILSKDIKKESIEMIDFQVEDNHNYFVDGILSHNSEHVPFLCVSGDSKILVETKKGMPKTWPTAKYIHDSFHKGVSCNFMSLNTLKGVMEYQPLLLANKTMAKKVTLSFRYESVNKTAISNTTLDLGYEHPVYVIGKGFVHASKVKKGNRVVYFLRPKFNQKVASKLRPSEKPKEGDKGVNAKCYWCGDKVKIKATFSKRNKVTCHRGICSNLKNRKYYMAEVTDVDKTDEVIEMYDFTVNKNHNFICNHVLVKNCLDEIDLIQDPRVLEEASMVPCTYGRFFPLTCFLSTRKFAGGLMEQQMKSVIKADGEILRWNILDVTERITKEYAQVDKPKVTKYISVHLPMETINPEDYEKLPKEKKERYERIEAYAGIAEHPMLPVMKNMLVDRPQTDIGGLYKPLVAVNNNFKATKPAMGEAQLLCNSPSTANLVYSRFDDVQNVISLSKCYEMITGDTPDIVSYDLLLYEIKALGLPVYGGADWGFTDYTTLTVFTILPCGSVISLYNEMAQNLEIDDIVDKVLDIQHQFDIKAWYPDQNYPAYLKTLNRKCGKKWKKFTKDVITGISSLQTKIVNSSNKRSFFVLDVPHNEFFKEAFGLYKWAKDGKGNIIDGTPYHDQEGVSDVMDAIRYPMQVLFGSKKRRPMMTIGTDAPKNNKEVNLNIMRNKIQELTGDPTAGMKTSGVKKFIV